MHQITIHPVCAECRDIFHWSPHILLTMCTQILQVANTEISSMFKGIKFCGLMSDKKIVCFFKVNNFIVIEPFYGY